jgi:hypothetical protein
MKNAPVDYSLRRIFFTKGVIEKSARRGEKNARNIYKGIYRGNEIQSIHGQNTTFS